MMHRTLTLSIDHLSNKSPDLLFEMDFLIDVAIEIMHGKLSKTLSLACYHFVSWTHDIINSDFVSGFYLRID